jgi:hypothetical protein
MTQSGAGKKIVAKKVASKSVELNKRVDSFWVFINDSEQYGGFTFSEFMEQPVSQDQALKYFELHTPEGEGGILYKLVPIATLDKPKIEEIPCNINYF